MLKMIRRKKAGYIPEQSLDEILSPSAEKEHYLIWEAQFIMWSTSESVSLTENNFLMVISLHNLKTIMDIRYHMIMNIYYQSDVTLVNADVNY